MTAMTSEREAMTPEQAIEIVNDAANDARHRGDYKRANSLVRARVTLYRASHLSQPTQIVDVDKVREVIAWHRETAVDYNTPPRRSQK